MTGDSAKKVAIITGASRGIGRGVALGLAADGYDTVLVARTESALRALAEEIAAADRDAGGSEAREPLFVTVDAGDDDAAARVVEAAMERHGRIDILFNNAGILRKGSWDTPLEDFDATMRINVRGCYLMARAVAPVMKVQGSGYLFNLASRAGKVGFPGMGTYCASKHALVGFSEALYKELAPEGIRVTALCPSWVNTDMADQAGCGVEPGRMIQVEDVLNTMRWLLGLSAGATVREVRIDCRDRIH